MDMVESLKLLVRRPTKAASRWFATSSWKQQLAVVVLILVATTACRLILGFRVYLLFFLLANTFRVSSMATLLYKICRANTCEGLSLNAQELMAMCMAFRVVTQFKQISRNTSFPVELVLYSYVGIVLDTVCMVLSFWVVYRIRTRLKSSYKPEQDPVKSVYVASAALLVALVFHKHSSYAGFVWNVIAASLMYMDAFSVLPQLIMMRRINTVEEFEVVTGRYMFFLGMDRLFNFAISISIFLETRQYINVLDSWAFIHLVFQSIHAFILADFCYVYLKALSKGTLPGLVFQPYPVAKDHKF